MPHRTPKNSNAAEIVSEHEARKILAQFDSVRGALSEFWNRQHSTLLIPADRVCTDSEEESRRLNMCHLQTKMFVDAALQHACALCRCVDGAVLPIPAFALGRCLIEAAAKNNWLNDISVSRADRFQRSFSIECDEYINLRKAQSKPQFKTEIQKMIEDNAIEADKMGFQVMRHSSGGIKWIGVEFPKYTSLSEKISQDIPYRHLSALSHASSTASLALGHQRQTDQQNEREVIAKRTLKPMNLAGLCWVSSEMLSLALRDGARFFGLDHIPIENLLRDFPKYKP